MNNRTQEVWSGKLPLKKRNNMDLQVHSVHFDADRKLLDFISKKSENWNFILTILLQEKFSYELETHLTQKIKLWKLN